MGIFDFFKKEKKLPWPKNEIIEKFEEELPDSVIRSVKIVSKLYDHAKDLNPLAQNSPKYFSGGFLNPPQKNVLVQCKYYENGEVKSIRCFRVKNKDVIGVHGYSISFYENGHIKTCNNFIEDIVDGMYISYYANGFIKDILNYDNNILEGLNYTYDENEKLSSVVNYQAGIQNGQVYAYHKNGNLLFEGKKKEGIKDGVWRIYSEEGNSIDTVTYDMGNVVEDNLNLDLLVCEIMDEWQVRELDAITFGLSEDDLDGENLWPY